MRRAATTLPFDVRVAILGLAQIVSWGTLFYSISVLGTPMRSELGASSVTLFGAFSGGMLLSGIAAPTVGRAIDRHGGKPVLCAGSVLGALSMTMLAAAHGAALLIAGWLLAGLASTGVLYDAGFATVHQFAGKSFRRAITTLTLLGGFASTVFWPVARYLLETAGWRTAFVVFAALHLCICLPVHLLCIPRHVRAEAERAAKPASVKLSGSLRWLAVAMSCAGFTTAAVAAHFITFLQTGGIAPRDAVLLGSLIGPMQVAGRVVEYGIARSVAATTTGTFAFGMIALALCILPFAGGEWIVALAFVILYGWSNGVFTIVRGTVPRALFGSRNYGALLGSLARPVFFARAVAPVTLVLLQPNDPAQSISPWILAGFGIAAFAAYRRALALAPRSAPQQAQHVADHDRD